MARVDAASPDGSDERYTAIGADALSAGSGWRPAPGESARIYCVTIVLSRCWGRLMAGVPG